MTIFDISADENSVGDLRCEYCWDAIATHIELSGSFQHNPDEHLVVCSDCAYLAGLLTYSCFGAVRVRAMRAESFLIPAFAPGADQTAHRPTSSMP